MNDFTLAITVLKDNAPEIVDWYKPLYVPEKGEMMNSLILPPLGNHPADLHRLDVRTLAEGVSPIEGWAAFAIRPEYNTNLLGQWKPVNLYPQVSEQWSGLVHFPIHTRDQEWLGARVVTYAFRVAA